MLRDRTYAAHDLGRYAVVSHDIELFRFWLSCCEETSRLQPNTTSPFLGFDTSDFHFALEHGFIEELSEMIKFTGAELPLDALIEQSGIHEEKKPRFYQGLSIGGKKMTNWARERGGGYQRALGESTPPLLQAAYRGGLAAVEWFLSDTPFRLYKEYGTKNVNDPRLKTLTKAHGGLDQTFATWLKQRSKLPQICAANSALTISRPSIFARRHSFPGPRFRFARCARLSSFRLLHRDRSPRFISLSHPTSHRLPQGSHRCRLGPYRRRR